MTEKSASEAAGSCAGLAKATTYADCCSAKEDSTTSRGSSLRNTAVAHDEDRINDLPIRGRCRHNPSDNLNFGMFGNWRDDWDNTLP